jgi:hypothetical protein
MVYSHNLQNKGFRLAFGSQLSALGFQFPNLGYVVVKERL